MLIDKTDRYEFEKIEIEGSSEGEFVTPKDLSTTFIHEGKGTLYVQTSRGLKERAINQGQGFIISPGVPYRFSNDSQGLVAFTVSSETRAGEPIIEIIDNEGGRRESELGEYKVVENPKRVDKPWGHELWISWFRDYHVLKQIGMNAGNQSSLQFHRDKLETNYLQEGSADVIEGYMLDPQAPETEVLESSKGIDFNKYRKTMFPIDHWTSKPGTVHRVIAKTDYLAYEVSTPELDDVIRLQDDQNRVSGRIDSEHKTGGNKNE
ncbi:hypothetical protein GOV13_03080 [Candidatus Pacearchaeota archaeon]|nr:hypothetical protein [Candidatus Pacearchaeota archaeon]